MRVSIVGQGYAFTPDLDCCVNVVLCKNLVRSNMNLVRSNLFFRSNMELYLPARAVKYGSIFQMLLGRISSEEENKIFFLRNYCSKYLDSLKEMEAGSKRAFPVRREVTFFRLGVIGHVNILKDSRGYWSC